MTPQGSGLSLRGTLALFLLAIVVVGGACQAGWLLRLFSAEMEQRLETQAELPTLLINSQQVWADLIEDGNAMRRLIGREHQQSLVIGPDGQIIYATLPDLRRLPLSALPDTPLVTEIQRQLNHDIGLKPCSGLQPIAGYGEDGPRLIHVSRIHRTETPTNPDTLGIKPEVRGRTVAWLVVVLDRSGLESQQQALLLRLGLGLAALLALTVPVAWFGMDRFIVRRIKRTVHVLEAFAAGAVDYRLPVRTGGDEITVLQQGTNLALDQIATRTRELHQAQAELEERVDLRTQELRQAQEQLVHAAHLSGRAEVAIGVLHNIGTEANGLGVDLGLLQGSDDTLPRILTALSDQATQEHLSTAPLLHSLAAMTRERANCQMATLERLHHHNERIQALIAAHQRMIEPSADRGPYPAVPVAPIVAQAAAWAGLVDLPIEVPANLTWRLPQALAVEILANLIANACRALPTPPPAEAIRIIARQDGGRTLVQIIDRGQGMTAEELVRAFRPDLPGRPTGSLGLHDQINRLRRVGGDLHLASDGPGCGTRATMNAPGGLVLPGTIS